MFFMLVNEGISCKNVLFLISLLKVLSVGLMQNPFYSSSLCCYFLKAVIVAGKTVLC